MLRTTLGLVALLTLTGCASSSNIINAPIDAGISRNFNAPYSQTKRLALESVQGLNVDINSTKDSGGAFSVVFSKPMSAFSWGEVGRIIVLDIAPQSRVTVFSEKRVKTQITGTDNDQFAQSIFEGIDHALGNN
ncbi:hypothetical protein [Marinobacterium rhizophilum]|uniref:Beta-barrel assembly machine subunit BamC n=1 Tax=Marinobacterium rhizophilum TaxID=420402 RepID=A0ABY5HPK4_9GAMM|nr:hypothetical protein [Marinobacterium rhizophilum]UTW12816.1 hypothetical protein KDW95_03830 [Marinobacterium rhizophilum]